MEVQVSVERFVWQARVAGSCGAGALARELCAARDGFQASTDVLSI